jgi:prepilin-type N-terminal cleavage/methylation domain-containing protein
MEIDALRRWGVMKACSSTVRTALAPPAAQRGFTLVELLLAVSLGSVVLAFLGGGLLVSELKVSARVQRNLYAKDAANRAIDLMRREASFSRFFVPANTVIRGSALADCRSGTPIAYPQRNNVFICFKTVAPSDLPVEYQSAYQGPCVLVRSGPPYNPDGTLDLTATSIVQVLLDGVARTGRFAGTLCPSTTAFEVTYGSLTSPSSGGSAGVLPLTRDANVAINLDSGVRYSFSVRAASNPAYDGKDLYANCTVLSPTGCGLAEEASYHFKPKMDSITELIEGKESRENIFYFEHPFGEYTLRQKPGSGPEPCTYSNCYVERGGFAVKMTNVDALIFADQEIRPST